MKKGYRAQQSSEKKNTRAESPGENRFRQKNAQQSRTQSKTRSSAA